MKYSLTASVVEIVVRIPSMSSKVAASSVEAAAGSETTAAVGSGASEPSSSKVPSPKAASIWVVVLNSATSPVTRSWSPALRSAGQLLRQKT